MVSAHRPALRSQAAADRGLKTSFRDTQKVPKQPTESVLPTSVSHRQLSVCPLGRTGTLRARFRLFTPHQTA